MAVNTRISNATAIDACNAVVDKIDAGTGAGYVEIRTGAPPTNVEDAASGTLLASITLQDPAFGNAADQNPNARATLNGSPSDSSANATGTAGWFRAYTSGAVGVIQGTAGTATVDMVLNDATFEAGGTVTITSWTVDMPET
jgi:hypothetical protein